MANELTPDEQALLTGLESLFRSGSEDDETTDLNQTLKKQIRDRLAPDRLSVGETMAVTSVAVVVLGLAGVHGWGAFDLLGSGVAVWLFVRAAHWIGKRSSSPE